jgi:hypothetical protein
MLDRIIERKRAIQMRSTFQEVSHEQQGRAHSAMPDHERHGRPLFLGERQEPRRDVPTDIAVKRK